MPFFITSLLFLRKTAIVKLKFVTGTTQTRKCIQSYRLLRSFCISVSNPSNSGKMRWTYSNILISFSNIVWFILCLRVSEDIYLFMQSVSRFCPVLRFIKRGIFGQTLMKSAGLGQYERRKDRSCDVRNCIYKDLSRNFEKRHFDSSWLSDRLSA